MLPFGVTIPATVPQRSENPEGLMNYPVFLRSLYFCVSRIIRLTRLKNNTANHFGNNPITIDVCLSVHRCICVEKKNQLDATEWFTALIICSICFGHFYAHHQELETICVCNYRLDSVEQNPSSRTHSLLSCLTSDHQQPSHCTP